MIKDLPLDKLHTERVYWPERNLAELVEDIQEFGLKFPVLVRTDKFVIDGWARVEAARQLGWTTIPCEITNDFLRQLEAINKVARMNGTPSIMRLADLNRTLNEAGKAWQFQARSDFRSTAGAIKGQPIPGEKEAAIGYRMRLAQAVGMSVGRYNEQHLFVSTVEKISESHPEFKDAAAEILAFIDATNGSLIGPSGGRDFLLNMVKSGPSSIPQRMQQFRDRQARKATFASERRRMQHDLLSRRAEKVTMPASAKHLGEIISALEGTMLAVRSMEMPDLDPELRKQLSGRIVAVRRGITKFAKTITQEGSSDEQQG